MIRLAQPFLGDDEVAAVVDVLRSGMIASGPVVEKFEAAFAAYIGVRHAVAVSNGTVALHAALAGAGVGPGERVVTTPFTFVATANSILHCGAVPVFSDIDADTFNLCPDALDATLERLARAGTPAKAVLLVHLFGLPCDMDAMARVAAKHDVVVIEDAAQAHGATYKGQRVGSFGTASTFSFYATKNMATGEGGMVVTDCDDVAAHVRSMVNHGRVGHYEHDIVGYNYRLTDVAAAMGVVQLAKLEQMNRARRKNAARLDAALAAADGVTRPVEPAGKTHVYHHYTVRHDERDALAAFLRERAIGTGVIYPIALHKQPLYVRLGYGDEPLPAAETAARQVLSLPVHPQLTPADVDAVAAGVLEFLRRPASSD